MKLRRISSDNAQFVYRTLIDSAPMHSVHTEGMSFDEFMGGSWPRTLYFGAYEDEATLSYIVCLVPDVGIDRSAEFGIVSVRRGSGKGVEATNVLIDYAFKTLGLHRLYTKINSDNLLALRLAERVGVRSEGRLVRAFYKNGAWIDQVLFAVTSEER